MIADQLAAAIGCPHDRAEAWIDAINAACERYAINTPQRLAAFLAQIGHESGGLRWVRELWGPTEAQTRYEGRKDLGNTEPGDGKRYCGRGPIQITGRFNYARVSAALGHDFVADPEALEAPEWGALSAAEYWATHGCNELADAGEFEKITRKINGGLNGQADRLKRWERAKGVLTITEGPSMPLPAIAAAVLPSIVQAVPLLSRLFGSGSEVAERNVKAAETVLSIATQAVGAVNAQDAAEKIAADPQAASIVAKAIEARWLELTESGGGGIEGARKADAAASGGKLWASPSFWVALFLLPLVYLLVLSLIGVVGTASWSDDVRAGLAGSLISAIIGGLVGYYYGQTTSRNRTPAQDA